MKRTTVLLALLAAAVAAAPALLADVKTTEKTTMKFEGFMGGMMSRMAGGADGITSTVAVKGQRMLRTDGATTGELVDLAEQKVYRLDIKKKEYTVLTFAQMRAEMEKAKADMEKQMQGMRPPQEQPAQPAAKEFEFDVKVDETGQRKTIVGQNTRQVMLVITMREKGKKLEEGGGFVMTNDLWIAPRVAALDELYAFQMKYFQAVYGGLFTGASMQQATMLAALLPGFGTMSEKMAAEAKKLEGTVLSTTTLVEAVKSAEQMKQVSEQQQQSRGGGGIMGGLTGRMMGNRGGGATEQRTKTFTTMHEYQAIAPAVTEADVAIPAGFKEKK
jgi:hypothetical protein